MRVTRIRKATTEMLLGVSRGAALFKGENRPFFKGKIECFVRQGTLLEGRTVLFGVRGTGGWGECLLGMDR